MEKVAEIRDLAAEYREQGFVVVPNLLTRDECRELKREGLEILEEYSEKKRTVFVGVAAASETYYRLASDPRIVRVLQQLMPEGIMFLSDKFVFKSGEHRAATPWHCDEAYWRNTRPKLSVWIPLDDVSADNGTLKVLPGGHQREWHHGSGGVGKANEFTNVISELEDEEEKAVVCDLPAGSALFFSDRLPHASCPNESGEDRYAIIGTYHSPGPDEEFDKEFTARHVIVPVEVEKA